MLYYRWCDYSFFIPPISFITQQQIFLKGGGSPDARNARTFWSLLHTACYAGQYQVALVLVSAGAKVDKEVEGRYTPLLLCCSCGSYGVPCPRRQSPESGVGRLTRADAECGHLKVGEDEALLVLAFYSD